MMRLKPSPTDLGESIKLTGVVNLGIGEAIIDDDDNQSVDSNRDSNSSSDYMDNLDFGISPTPPRVDNQAQKSDASDGAFQKAGLSVDVFQKAGGSLDVFNL